jgi:hypothetical protein
VKAMPASSTFAAWAVVILGLLLWGPGQVAAVGDQTPMAAPETPTPNLEQQLELYRNAVQAVTAAEVEHRKLLEAASERLVEYQKAVKASVNSESKEPNALGAAQAKILELASAAGLAVAAIFFGFFGVLVTLMPGLPDNSEPEKRVKRLYWKITHANAAGIVLSISASLCAMVALGAPSLCWAWCAVVFGALAVSLVLGITIYIEFKISQRHWHL